MRVRICAVYWAQLHGERHPIPPAQVHARMLDLEALGQQNFCYSSRLEAHSDALCVPGDKFNGLKTKSRVVQSHLGERRTRYGYRQ